MNFVYQLYNIVNFFMGFKMLIFFLSSVDTSLLTKESCINIIAPYHTPPAYVIVTGRVWG